jgi:hypothetical protein
MLAALITCNIMILLIFNPQSGLLPQFVSDALPQKGIPLTKKGDHSIKIYFFIQRGMSLLL